MAIEVATLDALERGLLLLEPMLLAYLVLMTLAILLSEPDLLLLVGQQLWGVALGKSGFFPSSDAFALSFIRKRTHSGTQNRLKLQNPTLTC
jgi:hypothetical protein